MNDYDKQYYFITIPKNSDHLPSLSPDLNTEDRRFRFEAQPLSSAPLVFHNGLKENNKKKNIQDIAADFLFDGSNFMVRSKVREALLDYDIPHLDMHPAIYIDDRDNWHEDYWYLTFTERFDCWDRTNSTYEDDPVEMGGFKLYGIYTHSLDKELLDKIPLNQRLLFKLGGTLSAFIVCHESISHLFYTGDQCGSKLTLISDY
ncbi:hypothetical protein AAKU55_004599 [Oxalobacteraceae bacterium GrIS 1.11]